MRWTERHHQMLAAMGLKPWGPSRPNPALAIPMDSGALAPPPSAQPIAVPAPVPASPPATATSPRTAPNRPVAAAAAWREALPSAPVAAATPVLIDTARAQRIATLDWTGLQAEVAACQACSLCSSRKQTVFGVGHDRAHWMIVGEAPGEQEDIQGEPFVGAAGQLLDQMLAALALSRREGSAAQRVFIANTLKCRPPRNRNPAPEELAQCAPFLQQQVALVRPKLILAMGRFAIHQLLGSDEPIGRLRGRLHDYRGTPVVVTYHPAYLLRQPLDKAKAWADLCLAADAVDQQGSGS